MKKLFQHLIFIAAVVLLSLGSCVSDSLLDPTPSPDDRVGERSVSLRLSQPESTRGVSRPICDGEWVRFNTGDLYLVSSAGVIVRHYRIIPGDNTVTNLANRTIGRGHLDTGVDMPTIPGNVTDIVIVGNHQGAGANLLPTAGVMLGSATSAIERRLVYGNILSQFHPYEPGVNMFGRTLPADWVHSHTDVNDVCHYDVVVHLAPTVARFELHAITGSGSIREFTVAGIFIDRHHRQAQINDYIRAVWHDAAGAATAEPNLRERPASSVPFHAGEPYYTPFTGNPNSGALFDLPAAAGAATGMRPDWPGAPGGASMTVRPLGYSSWTCNLQGCTSSHNHTNVRNVWGYHVFARDYVWPDVTPGPPPPPPPPATTMPPRIVIRLTNVYLLNGTPMGTQYITVDTFNRINTDGTVTRIQGIRASNVYRIENLVFDERDLSDRPNTRPRAVDITVTTAHWNEDRVFHSVFRQPNPLGGHLGVAPQSHPFEMEPAVNSGCNNGGEIRYQWQHSTVGGHNHADWSPALSNFAAASPNPHYYTGDLDVSTWFRRVAFCACGEFIVSGKALLEVEEPFLRVTPGFHMFLASPAATQEFTVETNLGSWNVVWMPGAHAELFLQNIDDVNNTFEVNATANTAGSREGILRVTAAGGHHQDIAIQQMPGNNTELGGTISGAFVGAFWRENQMGERLIRIPHTTNNAWTAIAMDDWILLCSAPSTALNLGATYTANSAELFPLNPNSSTVSNMITNTNTGVNNEISFRIGVDGTIGATGTIQPNATNPTPNATISGGHYTHRWGRVMVLHNNNQSAHIIWIRQGEAAHYVFTPTCPGGYRNVNNVRRWSPFNLTAPGLNNSGNSVQLPLRTATTGGGIPTNFPTQAGAFFKWAESAPSNYRRAWSPAGSATSLSWSTAVTTGFSFWDTFGLHPNNTRETCPPGYRRPGAVTNSPTGPMFAIDLCEFRQSLYAEASASNLSGRSNSVWGLYADGFFDRRVPTTFPNPIPIAVAVGTANVAVQGRLIFNATLGYHLFLPASGWRESSNGSLSTLNQGRSGAFWCRGTAGGNMHGSHSSNAYYVRDTSSGMIWSMGRAQGWSVRCVVE